MASENPDDKKGFEPIRFGSKKPHKLYKGVYEKKGLGRWYAQCSSRGGNSAIGTYDTELEAALAYDKRARELNRDESTLNFPRFTTGGSTLPIANPSASGVQASVPSGSSTANVGKGKKRKHVTVSKAELDAYLPYHEARKRDFDQRRQNIPAAAAASVSGGAIGSEAANISSVQPGVMEQFGNPGDLKDVPLSELLTDADKEFVESLLIQGEPPDDEDEPSN